jgi:sortase A
VAPVIGNTPSRPRNTWSMAERIAWILGLIAMAIWGTSYLAGVLGARHDLQRFASLRVGSSLPPTSLPHTAAPDITLWSPQRVLAWRDTSTQPAGQPLAILRIPKIGLEVAVLPGTDEFVLNRGVGHIEDTALPGTKGNSGIAGHRDGFFRSLQDIAAGDAIELETLGGPEMYRVERIWIVKPEDVSVLDPTPIRSLTLVTCYPFYFIGSAPERFIVRAVRVEGGSAISKR